MAVTAATAVGVALALDATVAEFPERVHPVALFGRVVGGVDRDWRSPAAVGLVVAVALPVGAAAVAGATTLLAGVADRWLGAVVAGVALFAVASLRLLVTMASEVAARTETDADAARAAVPALVGRDPASLSPAELRSAAVESAAENLADGLVAPLLGFALGAGLSAAAGAPPVLSLALGVAGATWVKAVNTLDSMLGYRSKPVGGASARLDDAVMWLPARVAAGLLALAGGQPLALVRARAWRREPASPNSGWPMATLAGVLDVELRKPGAYVLNPGAGLPTTAEARRGVRVVGAAGVAAFLLTGGAAWL